MTAPKRYYYVGPSSERAKIHRCYANSFAEGALTACGRATAAGWHYWLGIARVPKNRALCAQCGGK